jgi:hypothetical protein
MILRPPERPFSGCASDILTSRSKLDALAGPGGKVFGHQTRVKYCARLMPFFVYFLKHGAGTKEL